MKLTPNPRAHLSDGRSRDFSEGWSAASVAVLGDIAERHEKLAEVCRLRSENPLRAKSTSRRWRELENLHSVLAGHLRQAAKEVV